MGFNSNFGFSPWFVEKKNRFTNQNFILFLRSCSLFSFQTHLVCQVPPYINSEIIEPVTVQLYVTSSNKCSESHSFIYTPKGAFGSQSCLSALQSGHNKKGILNLIHYIRWILRILPKLIVFFFDNEKKTTKKDLHEKKKSCFFIWIAHMLRRNWNFENK